MFQILCVNREIYCSGPMQSLDANTAKHWVKMVKLCGFYSILWYFEKGLMGSL